jgi:hypothetical protein
MRSTLHVSLTSDNCEYPPCDPNQTLTLFPDSVPGCVPGTQPGCVAPEHSLNPAAAGFLHTVSASVPQIAEPFTKHTYCVSPDSSSFMRLLFPHQLPPYSGPTSAFLFPSFPVSDTPVSGSRAVVRSTLPSQKRHELEERTHPFLAINSRPLYIQCYLLRLITLHSHERYEHWLPRSLVVQNLSNQQHYSCVKDS